MDAPTEPREFWKNMRPRTLVLALTISQTAGSFQLSTPGSRGARRPISPAWTATACACRTDWAVRVWLEPIRSPSHVRPVQMPTIFRFWPEIRSCDSSEHVLPLSGIMKSRKSVTPTDRRVSDRVRMRRMVIGMGQAKLGDALGFTFKQVRGYEKGIDLICGSGLQHLCHILLVALTFSSTALRISTQAKDRAAGGRLDEITEFMAPRDGLRLPRHS
jgi:transcriptional regulator with XRE-family HTH domain